MEFVTSTICVALPDPRAVLPSDAEMRTVLYCIVAFMLLAVVASTVQLQPETHALESMY